MAPPRMPPLFSAISLCFPLLCPVSFVMAGFIIFLTSIKKQDENPHKATVPRVSPGAGCGTRLISSSPVLQSTWPYCQSFKQRRKQKNCSSDSIPGAAQECPPPAEPQLKQTSREGRGLHRKVRLRLRAGRFQAPSLVLRNRC